MKNRDGLICSNPETLWRVTFFNKDKVAIREEEHPTIFDETIPLKLTGDERFMRVRLGYNFEIPNRPYLHGH